MVCHKFPRAGGAGLAESLEVFFAAYVFQMRVCDDEVGCKHGRCQFSAVCAVAKKRVDEAGSLGGLRGKLVSVNYQAVIAYQHSKTNECRKNWSGLTNANWTAPQKQLADALLSVDQPSFPEPVRGIYGFDLSADAAIVERMCVTSDQWWTVGNGVLRIANCSATNVPTACLARLCLGFLNGPERCLA